MKIYVGLFFFFLIGCQNSDNHKKKGYDFTSKQSQTVSRVVGDTLKVLDKKNLKDLNLERASQLSVTDDNIFFIYFSKGQIIRFDASTLELDKIITIPKGRGPGESERFKKIDVHGNKILLTDSNQSKILVYSTNGQFIKEFKISGISFDRVDFIDEQRFWVKSMILNDNLFHLIDLDGNHLKSFQKKDLKVHIFQYTGHIEYFDGGFYFAGYSEPLIKKYTDSDHNEVEFSVSMIDEYDASANYVVSTSGDYRLTQFTPGALYSAKDIAVDNRYVYIPMDNNKDRDHKFIDIYSSNSGEYLSSYPTKFYVTQIAINEDSIYTIEYDHEKESFWLVKYNKTDE